MTEALAVQSPALLAPVMNVALAKERLMQFQQFIKEYMVENEDFGIIPGTPKPTLLKPGADKLCELYGLADEYEVTQRTEDWDRGLFDYEVKCILLRKPEMLLVSSGVGSCNSYEKKYRWRDAQRKCPNCGKETIIKGKEEYGGGWLCFAKKGGCGAKFSEADASIVGQTVGRVQNEDIADLKNTLLKMAKKRAKVDAVLSATRSSGIFTQDVEDWDIPKATEPPPASPTQPQPTTKSGSGETTTSSAKSSATSHEPQKPRRASAEPKTAQPPNPTPATPPAPPQGQAGHIKFVPPNGLITVIKGVQEVAAQPATQDRRAIRPYLVVTFLGMYAGCNFAYCFDTKLWDCIKSSVGLECHFQIKEGDKDGTHFINIYDVLFIDGQEYVDGKPVVQGEAQ